jgi:hypothetical protein
MTKVTSRANTYIKYLLHKARTNPSPGGGGGIEVNSLNEKKEHCNVIIIKDGRIY